jgi:hypothetical protein
MKMAFEKGASTEESKHFLLKMMDQLEEVRSFDLGETKIGQQRSNHK